MTTPDHRADLDQLKPPAPESAVWSAINALADRIAAMEAAVSAIAAKLEGQQ
jgi:hypothetical protein